MISDPVVASHISSVMLRVSKELNSSLIEAQATLPADEFVEYRRALGAVLGEILLSVLNPIYAAHPGLKPTGLE